MLNGLNNSTLSLKETRSGQPNLKIVILGLSITSSWGNGHAITYRGLMTELARRGHQVCFLERNLPWYEENRDFLHTRHGRVELYADVQELREKYAKLVRNADCVIVGSYVPDGIAVGEWVTSVATGVSAFYDIDTPVTLSKLELRSCEYLNPTVLRKYDLYLSFTGGPILRRIEKVYGAPMARVLYCSIDPAAYFPANQVKRWDLGYLGTYSHDRQSPLNELLLAPAGAWKNGRFVVAGPQYPEKLIWPENIERIEHLPPQGHRDFYNAQKFTLNITRADMIKAGYSPSIRLFEAAGCATPIITDYWNGLESIFRPNKEILIAETADDVQRFIRDLSNEKRCELGSNARRRVLREHTAAHRAEALENYIFEARSKILGNCIGST